MRSVTHSTEKRGNLYLNSASHARRAVFRAPCRCTFVATCPTLGSFASLHAAQEIRILAAILLRRRQRIHQRAVPESSSAVIVASTVCGLCSFGEPTGWSLGTRERNRVSQKILLHLEFSGLCRFWFRADCIGIPGVSFIVHGFCTGSLSLSLSLALSLSFFLELGCSGSKRYRRLQFVLEYFRRNVQLRGNEHACTCT